MYIEFPEIFTKMLADEMSVCIHAMRQKALLLDHLESKLDGHNKLKKL